MENKISVMIAEDHELFRDGFKRVVESFENTEVIAVAADGAELLELLDKHKNPDVIFMDVRMPNIDGVEATKIALKKHPGLNIVALSMYCEKKYLRGMHEAGAKGFLLKNIKKQKLEVALRMLAAGKNYYSDELMHYFTNEDSVQEKAVELNITEREINVLNLIAKGYNTDKISDILHISSSTVEKHRHNLLEKTNCNNVASLIIFAIEKELIFINHEGF